jgi:hypothetical protein
VSWAVSEDYPRTLLELEQRFNREEACAEYLAALRWPGGWICPRCAGAEAWPIRRNRWRCDQCRLGLQRVLGLGSYKTAWAMLHKLRRAMVRPGRERLSGSVEADETYLGGLEKGVRGRQTESKALIVVAAEEDGKGIAFGGVK